jgi:hypothetical protein
MKENESKKIQQKASSPFSLLKVLSHRAKTRIFFILYREAIRKRFFLSLFTCLRRVVLVEVVSFFM